MLTFLTTSVLLKALNRYCYSRFKRLDLDNKLREDLSLDELKSASIAKAIVSISAYVGGAVGRVP